MLVLDAVLSLSFAMFATHASAADPPVAPAELAAPTATDGVGELPGASGDVASEPRPNAADPGEIRSVLNNKCMDILGVDPQNGAHVVTWDCWGGANQRWYWDGQQIRSALNNKCLDILGVDPNNGAHVVMWDCWGGANQKWYWDGRQIRSVLNNKCLDILGVDPNNGAHLVMWDCWNGANQQWLMP
ncbi:RICIN domain-containing protein [Nannocystis sp. ILAH1]|uniref:RICIN domain-containing protein n=1 Tax=Nannocystis sp. ILAH1 TaxID=2996789 RepID=UPI002271B8D0|nr:RICIN domain-containing protein [Nannocystis sp. ILAH1]MCY0989170.1 RICIN domain-containing protein [Nannocystis sp. ILAH1]